MNRTFNYQDQVAQQFMEEKISYAKKKLKTIQPLRNQRKAN